MNAMTIYRIQDSSGRGPWRPGFSQTWSEPRDDHKNLPPFFFEFPGAISKALTWEHLGSGCRSVAQLRRWFTPSEYAKLLKAGYKAVQIEADRILGESAVQCLFARVKPLADEVVPFDLYEVSQ